MQATTNQRIMDRQQYATLQRKAALFDAPMEDINKEEKFYDKQTFQIWKFFAFNDIFYMFIFSFTTSLYMRQT